ncbi:hypothetical protein KM481_gp12 [Harp seal herpesvirus]|uniref:Uncharacterized protein n=1 Tax=phocid gammaherpesvirus 3 TaxID=2560643 RepID=A0A0R5Z2S3_9GAMA|nr:hypothetical protein KM481_gp12 [Harp seal herpesvirus]AJG42942.1 hypothetical protein [Harp seal herpesvirus]
MTSALNYVCTCFTVSIIFCTHFSVGSAHIFVLRRVTRTTACKEHPSEVLYHPFSHFAGNGFCKNLLQHSSPTLVPSAASVPCKIIPITRPTKSNVFCGVICRLLKVGQVLLCVHSLNFTVSYKKFKYFIF